MLWKKTFLYCRFCLQSLKLSLQFSLESWLDCLIEIRKHCSIFQKTYPRNQICLNGHFVVNVGIHRKYPRSIFRPSQFVKIKIFKSKCLKANHTISENSVYFLRCESFVTATTLFPSQTKHFSTFKHFWVNLYSTLNSTTNMNARFLSTFNISTYLIL